MQTETTNGTALVHVPSEVILDDMIEVTRLIDSVSESIVEPGIQVEESVETFDDAFKNDPLRQKYHEFGQLARELFDPSDTAYLYVDLGRRGYNLMCAEKSMRPAAYDRQRVVKKMESALRLSGVPESLCRPNEILGVFWVARLDQSTPGADGTLETRSYPVELNEHWFGGNISLAALRFLARLINRASGKDEIDVYDFDPGYESFSRSMIARLRRGEIGVRQLEARIKAERKRVEDQREQKATERLSHAEKLDRETKRLQREQEAKFVKLRRLIDEAQDYADKELKQSKEQMQNLLITKGVIPPQAAPTCLEFARVMTPGDAKGMVQHLAELAEQGDASREAVLRVLIAECAKCLKHLSAAVQKLSAEPVNPRKKSA